jgi:hypothetical protein
VRDNAAMGKLLVEVRVYCDARGDDDHAPPTVSEQVVDEAQLAALKERARATAGECPCGERLCVALLWRAQG